MAATITRRLIRSQTPQTPQTCSPSRRGRSVATSPTDSSTPYVSVARRCGSRVDSIERFIDARPVGNWRVR